MADGIVRCTTENHRHSTVILLLTFGSAEAIVLHPEGMGVADPCPGNSNHFNDLFRFLFRTGQFAGGEVEFESIKIWGNFPPSGAKAFVVDAGIAGMSTTYVKLMIEILFFLFSPLRPLKWPDRLFCSRARFVQSCAFFPPRLR